jgi:hypothetical protein
MTDDGAIIKLQHQFCRAAKLADRIQELQSTREEWEQAIANRPDTDYWAQVALLCDIKPPSETTQALTLMLLSDRERNGLTASAMGRIGGSVTAKRGPKFYRKINKMRKTHKGGRPKKVKQST